MEREIERKGERVVLFFNMQSGLVGWRPGHEPNSSSSLNAICANFPLAQGKSVFCSSQVFN